MVELEEAGLPHRHQPPGPRLGSTGGPHGPLKSMPQKQAAAAIGQGRLMRVYSNAFGKYGIYVAQILLTMSDLTDRKRFLNIRNTLTTLMDWGVIPIINENDTVSVDEIKFGDNDHLAAMMANITETHLLNNPHQYGGSLRPQSQPVEEGQGDTPGPGDPR